MGTLLLILHIFVCVVLIGVVLLQSGKAADLAGAFGGGGSQTALGSRGAATVLTKLTTISAILFMVTSLGLALLGSRHSGSVLESAPPATQAPAPPGNAPQGAAPEAAPATSAQPAGKEAAAPQGAAPAAGAKGSPPPAKPAEPKKTP
ncbi:MAG: preprotein translocase subunit SecG [Acidobacteria bacterium]|nr:MAG: preprotein translocase subunit SecG [Acidobacteriota bacterium]